MVNQVDEGVVADCKFCEGEFTTVVLYAVSPPSLAPRTFSIRYLFDSSITAFGIYLN